VHDWALFDLGRFTTGRTSDLLDDLLDHELDVGTISLICENPDIFEPHQGPDDLDRVSRDEGAFGKLAHTTTLEHLRQFLGDLCQGATPLRSEEPFFAEGELSALGPRNLSDPGSPVG
jgi:hypothetical protein